MRVIHTMVLIVFVPDVLQKRKKMLVLSKKLTQKAFFYTFDFFMSILFRKFAVETKRKDQL